MLISTSAGNVQGVVVVSGTDATPITPSDATAANQATQITALGAPADATWSGTGSGSIIAVLKAIWTAIVGTNVVDKSGTIAAGGTAQTSAAANTSRRGFSIQNNSTGDLWFSTLATAVASQPSMKVPAGGYFETPPGMKATGAISIIGATTGQAFSAREW